MQINLAKGKKKKESERKKQSVIESQVKEGLTRNVHLNSPKMESNLAQQCDILFLMSGILTFSVLLFTN